MKRAALLAFLLACAAPAAAQEEGAEPAPREEPAPPREEPAPPREAAPQPEAPAAQEPAAPARPQPRRPAPTHAAQPTGRPRPGQAVAPEPVAPEPVAPEPPVVVPEPEPLQVAPEPEPAYPEEEPGWPAADEPIEAEHPVHAEGEEAGHGAHGEGHAEVSWSEFAATVLNFLIWLAIIVFLMRKPLTAFLSGRRRAVVEGLEQAARLKAEAQQKYAEYSERLEHLDEELEKLRQEMIQAGESERDRIIAEAEARAARMRKDAQFVIAQQLKQLRTDLTREAIEAAVHAAEDVLQRETSISDQERLAQDYLGRIEGSIKDGEVSA